ncbi:rCG25125 [Rattus norvegicus]|uniref:RCG25125 n=1 Tax=Rattus norvegicus TaxID=10116 RepID=A6I2M9_RAT|nr:rCG25125 [Rattus norvegicus]
MMTQNGSHHIRKSVAALVQTLCQSQVTLGVCGHSQ